MPAQPQTRKQGSVIVVLLIVVALAGGAFYLYKNGSINIPGLTPTPTEEPRINPEPTSGYSISVGEVNPGSEIVIDSLDLSDLGRVMVYKDGKTETQIGRSDLLKAGQHTNITIKLTTAIKDGDVVYIRLVDKTGKNIQSDAKVNIEIMKNVGMLMSHYENEY